MRRHAASASAVVPPPRSGGLGKGWGHLAERSLGARHNLSACVASPGMRGGHRSDRSEVPPAFSRDLPPRYSADSAIAGSTRAARRAGTLRSGGAVLAPGTSPAVRSWPRLEVESAAAEERVPKFTRHSRESTIRRPKAWAAHTAYFPLTLHVTVNAAARSRLRRNGRFHMRVGPRLTSSGTWSAILFPPSSRAACPRRPPIR